MAILSDTSLLLNHIKNSFIYGDDTGICELMIEKELIGNYDLKLVLDNQFKMDIIDTLSPKFRSHSPEISISDTKPTFSRKLSSDIRIKEVEEEMALIPDNHKFIDTGIWPKNLDDVEIEELFGITESHPIKSKPVKSMLSKLLDEADENDTVSLNIFAQYASFSATTYSKYVDPITKEVHIRSTAIPDSDPNRTLKDFNVYFWDFLNQRDRQNPVIIRPVFITKVVDFIGLACWKYTDENRNPPLPDKHAVNTFQVYMFEDTDDLDLDFGCLHREDPIYKYQFTNLAVLESTATGRRKVSTSSVITLDSSFVTHSHIEKLAQNQGSVVDGEFVNDFQSLSANSDIVDDSILIQVQLAHGLSKFRFPPTTTMEQIVQHTMSKRYLQQHGSTYKYRLELVSDPGKELDSNKILAEIANPIFLLIRDMSRRKPAIPDSISEESSELLTNMIDLLQPQNFTVYLKQTLRRSEATMTVSGQSVEIEVTGKKAPLLIKPKVVRIPIAFIADIVLDTHGGQGDVATRTRASLKIVHLKRRSPLVRSLRACGEYGDSPADSEGSGGRGHTRGETPLTAAAVSSGNLHQELTSHAVSCSLSVARQIYERLLAILNLKGSSIRREFVQGLK